MAGFTAHGATFTFSGSYGSFNGAVVGISIESPTAEVANMTSPYHPVGAVMMVPTGDWSGGSITVDFISTAATGDVQRIVRGAGTLAFFVPVAGLVFTTGSSGRLLLIERKVILESASIEARTGDIVRGTLKFSMTDYSEV